MFRTYAETLEYLYHNLPMFQRIGAAAYKKDLDNTLALCASLNNPQHRFKSIHVAGTNGKGSTSHMLASVLQSAGYKTGLYTSPHLKDFTERIRINGVPVPPAFIVDFVNRIQPAIDNIQPSFFEITVAMAYDYFVQEQVDIAVIEVGLGGRLDSTNVIVPEVSVITNIGWDHKDILGDTLDKIAYEKAGIIKRHVPVVVSERQPLLEKVFQNKAQAEAAPIFFATDDWQVTSVDHHGRNLLRVAHRHEVIWEDLDIPLQGFYQQYNVAGVLKALDILQQQGWQLPLDTIRTGLEQVVTQTGLKGRWQCLGTKPLTICDTGHNRDGVAVVVEQIRRQAYQQLYMVWGAVKDKDIQDILRLLPRDAHYIFCEARIPRALDAEQLHVQAREQGLQGEVIRDVNAAIRRARALATSEDMIFIGGSTFVVAEIDSL